MTTEIASYTPTKAALAELRTKYEKAVYDVTTPKGMADAKAAKKELAVYHNTLEAARVKEKAESLAYGRRVDAEAKTIADQIAALKDPITAQIEVETKRAEREREAAIKAEQERLAAEERAKKEAEERRLAEERAKLAAEREALEKAQAVQREAEEKARREREETDRQARAKIDEAERAAKQRIEAAETEARKQRQAEEDRLRVERERVDAERQALAEAARAEQFRKDEEARAVRLEEQRRREAEENARAMARREEERKQAERLDSRQILENFCERFEHVHPDLAKHIREYLAMADLKAAA